MLIPTLAIAVQSTVLPGGGAQTLLDGGKIRDVRDIRAQCL